MVMRVGLWEEAMGRHGLLLVVGVGTLRPQSAVTSHESRVTISEAIWVTAAGCDEPVDPAEVALLEALPQVDDWTRDGSRLTLSGPDLELHFELVE